MFGGGTQIRTGDRGFANPGLTTWLYRPITLSILKDSFKTFNLDSLQIKRAFYFGPTINSFSLLRQSYFLNDLSLCYSHK